jgi:drug/metabolite transporter (DMT)-like permease
MNSPTPAGASTRTISPLPRPVVYGGLIVGILAVSTSAILATIVIGDPPDVRLGIAAAFWRCLGGALALAPFGWRARHRHPLDSRTARLLVVSGLFLAVHFALFLGSLAYTTVASSTTLATMSPLFVALGGAFFLGERTTRRTWIGMGLTMTGAIAIGLADLSGLEFGSTALFGDGMAFLSALAVTGYLLIGRHTRATTHASIYSGVVYATAAAALLIVCVAWGVPLWGYSTAQWLALAGLVIGPQLLGHTVFNTLMSSVPATVVSIAVLAEPVVATLLAWWLLSQLPAPLFVLAAPLVLIGVALAVTRPRKQAAPIG